MSRRGLLDQAGESPKLKDERAEMYITKRRQCELDLREQEKKLKQKKKFYDEVFFEQPRTTR